MNRKVFYLFITILTFSIGVFAVFSWYFDKKVEDKSESWKRVLAFEDQDLSKLSNEQKIKLFQDFYRLIDKQIYVGYGDEILFTKLSNEKHQTNYVFIGLKAAPISHSSTTLYFQVFDKSGNHLSSKQHEIDRRFDFQDLKILYSSEIGRNFIEVKGYGKIYGYIDEKETFLLNGNEINPFNFE